MTTTDALTPKTTAGDEAIAAISECTAAELRDRA